MLGWNKIIGEKRLFWFLVDPNNDPEGPEKIEEPNSEPPYFLGYFFCYFACLSTLFLCSSRSSSKLYFSANCDSPLKN